MKTCTCNIATPSSPETSHLSDDTSTLGAGDVAFGWRASRFTEGRRHTMKTQKRRLWATIHLRWAPEPSPLGGGRLDSRKGGGARRNGHRGRRDLNVGRRKCRLLAAGVSIHGRAAAHNEDVHLQHHDPLRAQKRRLWATIHLRWAPETSPLGGERLDSRKGGGARRKRASTPGTSRPPSSPETSPLRDDTFTLGAGTVAFGRVSRFTERRRHARIAHIFTYAAPSIHGSPLHHPLTVSSPETPPFVRRGVDAGNVASVRRASRITEGRRHAQIAAVPSPDHLEPRNVAFCAAGHQLWKRRLCAAGVSKCGAAGAIEDMPAQAEATSAGYGSQVRRIKFQIVGRRAPSRTCLGELYSAAMQAGRSHILYSLWVTRTMKRRLSPATLSSGSLDGAISCEGPSIAKQIRLGMDYMRRCCSVVHTASGSRYSKDNIRAILTTNIIDASKYRLCAAGALIHGDAGTIKAFRRHRARPTASLFRRHHASRWAAHPSERASRQHTEVHRTHRPFGHTQCLIHSRLRRAPQHRSAVALNHALRVTHGLHTSSRVRDRDSIHHGSPSPIRRRSQPPPTAAGSADALPAYGVVSNNTQAYRNSNPSCVFPPQHPPPTHPTTPRTSAYAPWVAKMHIPASKTPNKRRSRAALHAHLPCPPCVPYHHAGRRRHSTPHARRSTAATGPHRSALPRDASDATNKSAPSKPPERTTYLAPQAIRRSAERRPMGYRALNSAERTLRKRASVCILTLTLKCTRATRLLRLVQMKLAAFSARRGVSTVQCTYLDVWADYVPRRLSTRRYASPLRGFAARRWSAGGTETQMTSAPRAPPARPPTPTTAKSPNLRRGGRYYQNEWMRARRMVEQRTRHIDDGTRQCKVHFLVWRTTQPHALYDNYTKLIARVFLARCCRRGGRKQGPRRYPKAHSQESTCATSSARSTERSVQQIPQHPATLSCTHHALTRGGFAASPNHPQHHVLQMDVAATPSPHLVVYALVHHYPRGIFKMNDTQAQARSRLLLCKPAVRPFCEAYGMHLPFFLHRQHPPLALYTSPTSSILALASTQQSDTKTYA
ncbi:hypothetical protein HYPSUDRAFT_58274 [Hypholoma sublateritium FD-334 SS-4]|uniref:Uncharacterized protein n=1 Tax=Hypholoma sublateritium (strain FD-334 SS-4) TaxID=945553 RepID=A0A0D2LZJ8_HYPSF|nr:hypothetical protein HYPSUDRAFT_58274 [Hypholoma sublateritium FD-334 SS-4]